MKCLKEASGIGEPKIEVPILKILMFMNLSSLRQGTELETVMHCVVHNCPNLSLTSTTTPQELKESFFDPDCLKLENWRWELYHQIVQLDEVSKTKDSKVENSPEKAIVDLESQTTSGREFSSSQIEEKSEKELIEKVPSSTVPATITSTDSKLIERPSPGSLEIPRHETDSHECDPMPESTSQLKMNHRDPATSQCELSSSHTNQSISGDLAGTVHEHNQIESYKMLESERESKMKQKLSPNPSPNLTESIKDKVKDTIQEEAISEEAMKVVVAYFESSSSQSNPLESQHRSYPHGENRFNQLETCMNIEDLGVDDLINRVFQHVEEDGEGQVTTLSVSEVPVEHPSTKGNLVLKVLTDLEESLKMPLKDITTSEANTLRLLTALNFLSHFSTKDVNLYDGLKAIIDSKHKEFLSILCSFKQASATKDKFVALEAHQNVVAISLVSKISEAKNFMDNAQQKEAILKERIVRLEKEIKECEAGLSSIQEEKKRCIAETIGYKKEFEKLRKEKSQMVEDQRKVQQELFEIDYKWSALCSQFEYNRIAARNRS